MHVMLLLALLLVAAVAIAAELLRRAELRDAYRAKPLMTAPELEAHSRLRHALPDALICPQVQLCRFISADHRRDRRWHYRIAQLSADFAICDQHGTVHAVVEIDDRSHKRAIQAQRDRKKDDACRSAGIPVLRWAAVRLPNSSEMRHQVREALSSALAQSRHREFHEALLATEGCRSKSSQRDGSARPMW